MKKPRKVTYADLLKIKVPVLIEVSCGNYPFKLRILSPDGKCKYGRFNRSSYMKVSCFSSKSLQETVTEMEIYDEDIDFSLTLTAIELE